MVESSSKWSKRVRSLFVVILFIRVSVWTKTKQCTLAHFKSTVVEKIVTFHLASPCNMEKCSVFFPVAPRRSRHICFDWLQIICM